MPEPPWPLPWVLGKNDTPGVKASCQRGTGFQASGRLIEPTQLRVKTCWPLVLKMLALVELQALEKQPPLPTVKTSRDASAPRLQLAPPPRRARRAPPATVQRFSGWLLRTPIRAYSGSSA